MAILGRYVVILKPSGDEKEQFSDFELTDYGPKIQITDKTTVLIPWHRVLEVWNP